MALFDNNDGVIDLEEAEISAGAERIIKEIDNASGSESCGGPESSKI